MKICSSPPFPFSLLPCLRQAGKQGAICPKKRSYQKGTENKGGETTANSSASKPQSLRSRWEAGRIREQNRFGFSDDVATLTRHFTHLNAEFQRIARTDKKAFLSDQCKEIKENNRMGKTRDLFKKIKDRNCMDLTEAEDIKKRWQENTQVYKKDLNNIVL